MPQTLEINLGWMSWVSIAAHGNMGAHHLCCSVIGGRGNRVFEDSTQYLEQMHLKSIDRLKSRFVFLAVVTQLCSQ